MKRVEEDKKKKIVIKKKTTDTKTERGPSIRVRVRKTSTEAKAQKTDKKQDKNLEKTDSEARTFQNRESRPYQQKDSPRGGYGAKDKGDDRKKVFIKRRKEEDPRDKAKGETGFIEKFIEKTKENKKVIREDWKKKKLKKEEILERQKEKEFELQRRKAYEVSPIPTEIEVGETILVKDLAKKMNLKVSDLIGKLMNLGYMATINDALDTETAEIVASEYGCKVVLRSIYEDLQKLVVEEDENPENMVTRPPVVTVMGHVDHGKTSLLDFIRKERIADKEAGGITQHVGAYQVEIPKGKITFIDTPGHEAFTRMRERGAAATDIVVLVVAADDGIMPQTIEAINHAKAAEVPIVVAINKMDKESANPDRIKQQLAEHNLTPEEWGGSTMIYPISALKGTGIQELLEGILLEAEMKELTANPNQRAKGIILETKMDRSRGATATVILKTGTLKKGQFFVAGTEFGRIKALYDFSGVEIQEAGPSCPVEVLGFDNLPEAGDDLQVVATDKSAKEISSKRKEIKRIEQAKKVVKKVSLDDIYQQIQDGQKSEFNIIIKADVQGTVDAIKLMIEKLALRIEEVNVKVIHGAVGSINENDVVLASASKAIIAGFNVRPNGKVTQIAKEKGIEIRRYSIIYEIIEDIKDAVEGMLAPEEREEILGSAEVRDIFKVPKIGLIAGCFIVEGMVRRTAKVRVLRDDIVIHDGKISSLKRFKDDVREVQKGYECGVGIDNFHDLKETDQLEFYEIKEIARKLVLKSEKELENPN